MAELHLERRRPGGTWCSASSSRWTAAIGGGLLTIVELFLRPLTTAG